MAKIELERAPAAPSKAEDDKTTVVAAAVETTDKAADEGKEIVPETTTTITDDEPVIDVKSKHIEVNEEGLFVYRVNPEDPKSSFYTGKDMDELMANVSKGIAEKDATLRKRRVTDRFRDADENIDQTGRKNGEMADDAPLIDPPDRDSIIREGFKEANISVTFLSMTAEQWVKYAEEKNLRDWQVSELRASVKEAYTKAMEIYDDKNVTFINAQMFQDDIQAIAELLEESDADPDDFDLETVVDAVRKNPANYKQGGVVRSGVFVKEAAKIIRTLEKPKVTSKIREKLDEQIARGDEEKAKVRETGGATGAKPKKTSVVPRNPDELWEQSLEMLRKHEAAKQRKSS